MIFQHALTTNNIGSKIWDASMIDFQNPMYARDRFSSSQTILRASVGKRAAGIMLQVCTVTTRNGSVVATRDCSTIENNLLQYVIYCSKFEL